MLRIWPTMKIQAKATRSAAPACPGEQSVAADDVARGPAAMIALARSLHHALSIRDIEVAHVILNHLECALGADSDDNQRRPLRALLTSVARDFAKGRIAAAASDVRQLATALERPGATTKLRPS
jgi:hypothetical protein